MILINKNLVELIIIILAICGFFIAKYIRRHKTQNTPLVCPIRFDCHTVVHSDYARFLGIPVEILGMLYYAFTAIIYAVFIFAPQLLSYTYIPTFNLSLMLCLALAAFLFSAYLIAVQIFILKKGCSWCIISAFVCLTIFILAAFLYDFSFVTQIFSS